MRSLRQVWSKALPRLLVIGLLTGLTAFLSVYLFAGSGKSGNITNARCEENVTCVYLKADHAMPDVAAIEVGKYVQFSSADGKTHNLGLGQGDAHHDGSHKHEGSFASGDFKADEAWKVRFKQTGTYELHDHYRPDIRFTVIVYDPNHSSRVK